MLTTAKDNRIHKDSSKNLDESATDTSVNFFLQCRRSPYLQLTVELHYGHVLQCSLLPSVHGRLYTLPTCWQEGPVSNMDSTFEYL